MYNAIDGKKHGILCDKWVDVENSFGILKKTRKNINILSKNKTEVEYMIQYSWNSNPEWEENSQRSKNQSNKTRDSYTE